MKKMKGFTLVEMAIVLVIIGIILAGVMKGRDIVRGAQVKQFSQQFAQKWATVAQTYYDKTGQLLLDGTDNGHESGIVDGVMDGGLATSIDAAEPILEAVGITPCTLIKSKLAAPVNTNIGDPDPHCEVTAGNQTVNIVQTQVEGEYAGTQTVDADLATLLVVISGQSMRRNFVILYNVPTDVAQGLDTAIDGRANGQSGSCVALTGPYTAGGPTALETSGAYPNGTAIDTVDWATAGANTRYAQTVGIMLDY